LKQLATEKDSRYNKGMKSETLQRIAKNILGFNTLATQCSDRRDFREVAVWNVKAALEEAYEAGLKAGKEGK
jgi:hypothetical protein